MSKTMFFKSLLKDGYILKNRIGYEFIVMPSIDKDFSIDDGEQMGHVGTSSLFTDDLISTDDRNYDIMQISYDGKVIWEREE